MGRNVAAGMTGGLGYILDDDDTLIPKVHLPLFSLSFPFFFFLVFLLCILSFPVPLQSSLQQFILPLFASYFILSSF